MAQFDIVTREDLRQFKEEMIAEIKSIIQPKSGERRKWLRSSEVRDLLGISPGTLQNLRVNGTLRFTKVGSILFYSTEDIDALLNKGQNGN